MCVLPMIVRQFEPNTGRVSPANGVSGIFNPEGLGSNCFLVCGLIRFDATGINGVFVD
jgi:hypothetical protein